MLYSINHQTKRTKYHVEGDLSDSDCHPEYIDTSYLIMAGKEFNIVAVLYPKKGKISWV